jgi:hypothetical protein
MQNLLVAVISSLTLLAPLSNLTAAVLDTSGLSAATSQARMIAFRDLSARQDKYVEDLIEIAKTNNDESFYGAKSAAIQLLGQVRAAKAKDVLMQNLMFCPLDRDEDEVIPTQAFYLAAGALAGIGRPATDDVLTRMANTSSVQEAKLCAWILKESLGQNEVLRLCREIEARPDSAVAARGVAMKDYIINFKPTGGHEIK